MVFGRMKGVFDRDCSQSELRAHSKSNSRFDSMLNCIKKGLRVTTGLQLLVMLCLLVVQQSRSEYESYNQFTNPTQPNQLNPIVDKTLVLK